MCQRELNTIVIKFHGINIVNNKYSIIFLINVIHLKFSNEKD